MSILHGMGTGMKGNWTKFPPPQTPTFQPSKTLKFYCQLNEGTSRHICSWEWSSTHLEQESFGDHKVRNMGSENSIRFCSTDRSSISSFTVRFSFNALCQ
jgi:hypothetical protein